MRFRWSSSRILGLTACVAGAGLIARPDEYSNTAYRVLFSHMSPTLAGLIWLVIGLLSIFVANRWTIALIGSALIAWGLGLGVAALTQPPSGSPFGWVWYVGFGIAVLRTLAVNGPERMRS